jgi:hypothetical protein
MAIPESLQNDRRIPIRVGCGGNSRRRKESLTVFYGRTKSTDQRKLAVITEPVAAPLSEPVAYH